MIGQGAAHQISTLATRFMDWMTGLNSQTGRIVAIVYDGPLVHETLCHLLANVVRMTADSIQEYQSTRARDLVLTLLVGPGIPLPQPEETPRGDDSQ